jgi:BRCT domain type II-containing protein
VVALAQPAPHDAEPDTPSIEPLAAVVRRLGRGLPGSTVYLAGEFKHLSRDKIAAAIEAAGARLVAGPFPGTDYYVHGDWCRVQTIAQLERQGARRLRELEDVGRPGSVA